MKNLLLTASATLLLAACGAQSNTASTTTARQSPAELLSARLAHVACVKFAEPEQTVGLPEDPNFHSTQTGRVIVAVKDGYTVAQCVKQVKTKLPRVQIVEQLDTLKMFLVK